jgi:HEAT repeat protein
MPRERPKPPEFMAHAGKLLDRSLSPDERSDAAISLASLGHPAAFGFLAGRMDDNREHPRVQDGATIGVILLAKTLGPKYQLKQIDAIRRKARLANGDMTSHNRAAVMGLMTGMSALRSRESLPKLVEMLEDPDRQVVSAATGIVIAAGRRAAMSALGNSRGRTARKLLEAFRKRVGGL